MTELSSPRERYDYGRSLRKATPLESHAEWTPADDRPDPVRLIEEQNEDRLDWLVPLRRQRMAVTPFTFYRGAARLMACDLAASPMSTVWTQICGDAHLANFGAYASPERRLVFDVNDFDETLPGPWEWDVKRLVASLFIAGRHNGLSKKESRRTARRGARTYRRSMATLAEMGRLDVWYSLVDVDRVAGRIKDPKRAKIALEQASKARRKNSMHALRKLGEKAGRGYRIRHEPPLVIPAREIPGGEDALRDAVHGAYEEYQRSLPDHVGHVLRGFRVVDLAVKVVGVGSVGTRCFILLLEGRDRDDPLFLQIKEAGRSVLEEHLPKSLYRNPGRRVVEGQRLMQTVSDIFLGWARGHRTGSAYYVRQLKDWKASIDVDAVSGDMLHVLARNRGWTLARAHARSGDPMAIAGYLGDEKTFDRAVVAFGERYARQNAEDHARFVEEIESGRLEASDLV